MIFGIGNKVIPPAPQVNTTDFNTGVIVGIAPKGPTQALTVCGSDTDDSAFGKCLTGFNIPRALSTWRQEGAGKMVVVNVFDKVAHTSQVTDENATVTAQLAASAYDPIEIDAVAATAIQTVSTGAASNDTLASLKVGSVDLISGPILFTSGTATQTAQQIVDKINAYTGTSGYSATIGATGAYTITGPLAKGSTINGVAPTFGTVVGTMVLAAAVAFSGGVNTLMLVKNTPVSLVSAVAPVAALAVTTAPAAGNTLASLKVGTVDLLAGAITFVGTTATTAKTEIVDAINAYTGTSGFTAVSGTAGAFTIVGTAAMGATINGVITTIGTIVGVLAINTNGPFTSGVTGVAAVAAANYVQDTDYSIDEYGRLRMLIAVPDGTVIRLSYKKLNAGAVDATAIIGAVSGATRTGCKLIDSCATLIGLVPKILIIPGYNALASVQIEMERLATAYRMRTFYGSTAGMTLAQAKSSRGPSGPLATFNNSSKRALDAFPLVKTYDPKSASLTLDDPSAALAGHLSWSAAINGPHVSTSNTVVPSIGGVEINLVHQWEDANSAADTNQLRNAGIVCVFSEGGFKWWGAENSSFPANTAVDQNICVIYVNDIITDSLTKFAIQYVDKNITSGSIAAFVTAANGYYSSLMAAGWIGGDSKVSYKPERNPSDDLAQGKIRFTRNTFYFVGMKYIELEENMEVQLPTIQ